MSSSSSSSAEVFGDLSHAIEDRRVNVSNLESLAEAVASHLDAFDEDDLKSISDEIERIVAEIHQMEEELKNREHTYQTTVLTMERALELRERILDEHDNALEQNPMLMEKLASKQADLISTLQIMKRQLFQQE